MARDILLEKAVLWILIRTGGSVINWPPGSGSGSYYLLKIQRNFTKKFIILEYSMIYSIFDNIYFRTATKIPRFSWYSRLRIRGSGIQKTYFRILNTVEKDKCVSAARLSLSVLSWLRPLAHEEALDRLSPSNSSSKFGSGSPPSSGDSLWQCEMPWNYHFVHSRKAKFHENYHLIIVGKSSSQANFFFGQSLYFQK